MEKHYYIFIDAESFYTDDSIRVHKTFVQAELRPLPPLLKYHRFLEKEAHLGKHDYLYQANGNSCCVDYQIVEDLKKNKIAKAHGESHVNHYFCKLTKYRLLFCEYV